jgi:Spy/CpxP family protein refolding chaperone
MSLHRAFGLALPIAMTLAIGCSSTETPPPAPTATATAAVTAPVATAAPTATSAARDHAKKRWRGGRGIAGMLFHAADDLDLKDAQKATVEKLAEQLRAGGPRTEMKDYHTALVAQVRAGKIDAAKLDPLHAAVEKAEQARKDKEAEALNGLYAALEPAQRKALVAAVRAKQAEHAGKMEKKAEDTDWAKHHLEHLTKQVDLDAAQQKRVEPLMAKDAHPAPDAMRDEMKKHGDAVLAAFEADGFDAKKLEAAPPAGKKGPQAAHVDFLTALLPILKPEQREKLAASMEKMPEGRHEGGMGPGGGGGDEEHEEEAPAAQ